MQNTYSYVSEVPVCESLDAIRKESIKFVNDSNWKVWSVFLSVRLLFRGT